MNKIFSTFCTIAKTHFVIPILILLVVIFSYLAPHFLELHNLMKIILQNTYLFIIVIGLSFIMISGGIDLSIGYQISLVSGMIGILFQAGWSSSNVVIAGVIMGILCGLCNGILISILNMQPLMATLATQILFRGLAYTLTKGQSFFAIPEVFKVITKGEILGIKFDIILVIVCFLFALFVFRYTYFGKYIRALGQNEAVLKGYGVNIVSIKIVCYCLGGIFFSIAAMILVAKNNVASANYGVGYEVMGIAAAFIGGAYRNNENVSVWDLLIAALIISIIDNGMLQLGYSKYLQYILIGIILIISTAIQKLQIFLTLKKYKS